MATSIKANRAVTAGVSGGIGVVLPLAAVAATVPFGGTEEAARMALPFAVGALAGVGLFALTDRLSVRAAERRAAEEAEAAAFTSIFNGADAVEPHTAQVSSESASVGKRFTHRAAPKGVPVISRAVDALDEADAWAEIDAMLNDDSPISCDPTRSKDMYEIALDELRRAERARAEQASPADEVAAAPVSASAAAPESTDVFLALAAGRPTTASVQPETAAPAAASAVQFDVDEAEETSARAAAMASLYGASAEFQPSTASAPAAAPAPVPAPATVAVADYTGHESTWAAALAILEDDTSDAPSAVSPSETAYVAPGRMAAVAEGGNATRDHAHVNALIKEEFDRVSSSSVRRTSREYLRVIQGGTASMPRLQAQA